MTCSTYEVELTNALGKVLAEDVTSTIDVPGFDRSTMDGYAVKAQDTFSANEVKKLTSSSVKQKVKDANIQKAILSNLTILNVLSSQIKSLEQSVLRQVKLKPEFQSGYNFNILE